jgi:hypothetical protein
MISAVFSRDRQFGRRAGQRAFRRAGDDHDRQRQDVGCGVEQMIARGHADRLQRRPKRCRAAKSQRRPQAQHRIPSREDHQCDRGNALSAGEALVPAAGIEQRQERAADAGKKAADHGRAQPDRKHGIAHGASGVRAFAGGADQEAPARGSKGPVQDRGKDHADQEQHIDPQRRADLRDVAPPAENDRGQPRRGRLDQWFSQIEREPCSEQHQRDADRDVVDPRQRADAGVQRAKQRAGDAGGEHAEPG